MSAKFEGNSSEPPALIDFSKEVWSWNGYAKDGTIVTCALNAVDEPDAVNAGLAMAIDGGYSATDFLRIEVGKLDFIEEEEGEDGNAAE